MKRSKPLQRSGFKRPERERTSAPAYRLARPCSAAVIDTAAVPVPKSQPVRSESYRRLVAALPCIHCGIEGFSNHAHANTGKGVATKVCDLFAFPLCVDRPGVMGCHSMFDQHALFAKPARRVIEQEWARRTVRFIVAAGHWPAGLSVPDWAEA
jgi:hypothetical protein